MVRNQKFDNHENRFHSAVARGEDWPSTPRGIYLAFPTILWHALFFLKVSVSLKEPILTPYATENIVDLVLFNSMCFE